jgi:hypothetical protein
MIRLNSLPPQLRPPSILLGIPLSQIIRFVIGIILLILAVGATLAVITEYVIEATAIPIHVARSL